MSDANGAEQWEEVTVPSAGEDLLNELHTHGVVPGRRLRFTVLDTVNEPENDALPSFVGSFNGPDDLAGRAKEILRTELGRR